MEGLTNAYWHNKSVIFVFVWLIMRKYIYIYYILFIYTPHPKYEKMLILEIRKQNTKKKNLEDSKKSDIRKVIGNKAPM